MKEGSRRGTLSREEPRRGGGSFNARLAVLTSSTSRLPGLRCCTVPASYGAGSAGYQVHKRRVHASFLDHRVLQHSTHAGSLLFATSCKVFGRRSKRETGLASQGSFQYPTPRSSFRLGFGQRKKGTSPAQTGKSHPDLEHLTPSSPTTKSRIPLPHSFSIQYQTSHQLNHQIYSQLFFFFPLD